MHHPMDSPPDYDRIEAVMTSVEAPHALRERIAAERDRTLIRRMVVKRMKLTGALAGAAAVLGAGLALLAPSGGNHPPGPLDAAALAMRGSVASAPRPSGADPRLLAVKVAGLPFPAWAERFPWKASGQRADALGDRTTLTVYYDNPQGTRLGYTIVDGKALPWPDGAQTVTRNGVEVHLLHNQGRVLAFWREHGHTCVISAPESVPEDRMITLASADDYIA
jgi:hypothetical protein